MMDNFSNRLASISKLKYIFIGFFIFFFTTLFSAEAPLSLFPIENYNQSLDRWLSPNSLKYNEPLVTIGSQKKRLQEFYNHFYSTSDTNSFSPWSKNFVNEVLSQKPSIIELEENLLKYYSDEAHIGYGENFRPLSFLWINQIKDNLQLKQLNELSYDERNRAITIMNINARLLPSSTPHFYHFTQAGQGYPFDNLQFSSIWAGTPVYIVGQSKNKAWDLVMTPSFIAWVPSTHVARTNKKFVKTWSKTAKANMAATIHTKTAVVDENGQFQFFAYVGSVFPLVEKRKGTLKILIPEAGKEGFAKTHTAVLSDDYMAEMPVPATRKNFSKIIGTLLNRPYGWGGLYFYNDCSQELKSLFAPFGFWLPRQSSDQITSGKIIDMTQVSPDKRINYLLDNGHPLMTIVYIGGHIFLYVGNDTIPGSQENKVVMTYQNIWGLKPSDKDERVVIGESVFFPLLEQYPEDLTLVSLANKHYFRVGYLDEKSTDERSYSKMVLNSLLP